MNEKFTNDAQQRARTTAIINGLTSGAIRIISVVFWCSIYIGFVWFLDDRTILEKLIGFTALVLGVVGVVTPITAVGQKYWLSIMGAFLCLRNSTVRYRIVGG